jgi:hypothetical protein
VIPKNVALIQSSEMAYDMCCKLEESRSNADMLRSASGSVANSLDWLGSVATRCQPLTVCNHHWLNLCQGRLPVGLGLNGFELG